MKLTTTSTHDRAVCDAVWQGLLRHNTRFAERNHQDFTVALREGRRIIGGAVGETKFGWTIVQYLWAGQKGRPKGDRPLLTAID